MLRQTETLLENLIVRYMYAITNKDYKLPHLKLAQQGIVKFLTRAIANLRFRRPHQKH